MLKKRYDFRLSESALDSLTKYQLDHKLASMTEALEAILKGSLSLCKQEEISSASDLLPCKQRITIANELSCMNPPTLYKKVKITEISLEICRACQVLSKNLPEKDVGFDKYAVKEAPKEETFDRAREPIRDPNNQDEMRNGKVWCPEGLWVFPNKCDRCKERTYAAWFDCQKQKLRKRGEQQRTASNA